MTTGPGNASGASRDTPETQLLIFARELRTLREERAAEQQEMAKLRRELRQAHAQQLRVIADLRQAHADEQVRSRELGEAYIGTITVLAAAVETKDDYTGGHIERVRRYSLAIGRRLGVPRRELDRLEVGAILHDLGKVGVPDAILTKPGKLDAEEWRLMRQHPGIGSGLLLKVPLLAPAAEIVNAHHERWDGAGYPRSLRGEDIPLASRIVAVADAYDAMSTSRVYRQARGIGEAVTEVQRCAGSHFDPAVAEAFMACWKGREIG